MALESNILPILAACHHRPWETQTGSYIYIYGLLVFPGEKATQKRASFCLAVQRISNSEKEPGLLRISGIFETSNQLAMSLFERIAFAKEPVSPHHIRELVADLAADLSVTRRRKSKRTRRQEVHRLLSPVAGSSAKQYPPAVAEVPVKNDWQRVQGSG